MYNVYNNYLPPRGWFREKERIYMKIKIGTKIVAGYLIIVLLVLLVGGYAIIGLKQINDLNTNIVEKNLPGIMAAKDTQIYTLEKVAALRAFMITGEDTYTKDFLRYAGATRGAIEDSTELYLDEEDKALNEELMKLSIEYDKIAEVIIILKRHDSYEEAVEDMKNKAYPKAQELKVVAEKIISRREANSTEDSLHIKEIYSNIWKLTALLLFIAVVISMVVGISLSKSITKPIKQLVEISKQVAEGDLTKLAATKTKDELALLVEYFNSMIFKLREIITQTAKAAEIVAETSGELSASAEEVSASAQEVSATITEVANTTNQQFSSVEVSSELINEVSNSIKLIASNAKQIDYTSKEALASAEKGMGASQYVVEKMSNIKATTLKTSKVVMELEDSSREIEKIVDTIASIAGQTNLLSLNAAIEAARAGEAGRGFAVVAEEVRKLAEESAQSSKQISDLIIAIQDQIAEVVSSMRLNNQEVESGEEIVITSNKSFEDIYQNITHVVQQITEMTVMSLGVEVHTKEVTENISAIAGLSENTAAAAQEVASSSQEQAAAIEEISNSAYGLAAIAEELRKTISIFKY